MCFTVMAPTAFSLFVHISGIVLTSEVNVLRLTWCNIYSIFMSDSKTNFMNMLCNAVHFQQQLTVDLWAPGGVSPGLILEKVMKWSLCLPCPFSRYPSSMAGLTLLCHSWPLVKKKSPRGHGGSPQTFEGLSYRGDLVLYGPKELAGLLSFIHSFTHY